MEGEGEAGGRGQLQDEGRGYPAAVRTGELMGDLLRPGSCVATTAPMARRPATSGQLASDLAGAREVGGRDGEVVRAHLSTDSLG